VKALLAALALVPSPAPANVNVFARDVPPRWSTSNVEIAVGDTVTWRFDGTQLAHNVASSGTNWSFVTPFDGTPKTFTFTSPGTYRFICQAHAFTMNGEVKVGTGGPAPTPGNTAWPNGSSAPRVDRRPPAFDDLRLRRRAGGARLRFRMSERARMIVRVNRGDRLVWRRAMRGRKGVNAVVVGGLAPGRYRVSLRARDFGGNPSRVVRLPLVVYR
jgi:plastocyanin